MKPNVLTPADLARHDTAPLDLVPFDTSSPEGAARVCLADNIRMPSDIVLDWAYEFALPGRATAATRRASPQPADLTLGKDGAERADSNAICALLAHPAVSIQEATLDALVAQSRSSTNEQVPLTLSPVLSPKTLQTLAAMAATELSQDLLRHADLASDAALALQLRLTASSAPNAATRSPPGSDAELLAAAHRLDAAGALNETSLLDSARHGDQRQFAAQLSIASDLPLTTIDRMAALRNAKGLVSVVWRAGFSMRVGSLVQVLLGQLGPDMLLPPALDGGFPLSVDEMRWQLELAGQSAREASRARGRTNRLGAN